MINQSPGCDFSQDGYIAIRLCCDVHHKMTKNSRNSNSSGNVCIIVEKNMHFVCLSFVFSFMCQHSKVVGNNKLSIGIHRYLVITLPPVISF
jgi:hypothetical protein